MATKATEPTGRVSTPTTRAVAKSAADPSLTFTIAVGLFAALYAAHFMGFLPINVFADTFPSQAKVSCDVGSWSLANLSLRPVDVIEWAPHLPFTRQLAAWREPTILKNTVVTTWKALKKWTSDDYLRSFPHMKMLNESMIGQQCMFLGYDAKTPLAKAGIKGTPNFVMRNVTANEFFSSYLNPADKRYWFWYGHVEGGLRADIEPSHFLWVDPLDEKAFGLYMWLSAPDIGPWLHYDQDHNFYVQVTGTKRFVLFPPWESDNVYPYPRTHPHWHKSQVNFDNPDLGRHPNYAKTQGYIAELQPGDVLHVPAYWWHHVRSHERSVSLASWSQSGVFRKLRFGLYEITLEIDKLQRGSVERKAGAKVFFEQLLESIYGPDNTFIESMLESRWNTIANELPPVSEEAMKDLCQFGAFDSNHFGVKFDQNVEYAKKQLESCQTTVDDKDAGIGINRKDMQAIRDTEVAEYIEFILSDVIPPEQVYHFLKQCF